MSPAAHLSGHRTIHLGRKEAFPLSMPRLLEHSLEYQGPIRDLGHRMVHRPASRPRAWRPPLPQPQETHSLPRSQEDPGYECRSLAPVPSLEVTRWDRPMTNNQPSHPFSPHLQGLSLGSRKLPRNLGGGGGGAPGTKMLRDQRQNRKVWERQDSGRRRRLPLSPVPRCH